MTKSRKVMNKEYYEMNKEKLLAQQKTYRTHKKDEANLNAYREDYHKDYYQTNKEKIQAYQKVYRIKNKDKIKGYSESRKNKQTGVTKMSDEKILNDKREKYLNYQKQYNANRKKMPIIAKEKRADYYDKNREERLNYQRAYQAENRDKLNAYQRNRYHMNKEKNKGNKQTEVVIQKMPNLAKEKRAEFYEKNKDRLKDYQKSYYDKNRDSILAKCKIKNNKSDPAFNTIRATEKLMTIKNDNKMESLTGMAVNINNDSINDMVNLESPRTYSNNARNAITDLTNHLAIKMDSPFQHDLITMLYNNIIKDNLVLLKRSSK